MGLELQERENLRGEREVEDEEGGGVGNKGENKTFFLSIVLFVRGTDVRVVGRSAARLIQRIGSFVLLAHTVDNKHDEQHQAE